MQFPDHLVGVANQTDSGRTPEKKTKGNTHGARTEH